MRDDVGAASEDVRGDHAPESQEELLPTSSPAERLEALAGWESRFTSPDFVTGQWVTSEPDDQGVIQMPWFGYGPELTQFEAEMYALGWVQQFDWMTWAAAPDARRLLADPARVADVGEEVLAHLLTMIIRGERFSEGEIAGAFDAGLLTAIARRAGVLSRGMQRPAETRFPVSTDDLPFSRYRGGGRNRLKPPTQGDGTARHGYGPPVFAQCGFRCVYCGLDMSANFESWLQLSVDHVIPRQMKDRGWDKTLVEDISNLVTCCRACNDFGNRYVVTGLAPTTDQAFWDHRDLVFHERKAMILAKRGQERAIFEKLPAAGPELTPPPGEDA